jgi:hypothetical protein
MSAVSAAVPLIDREDFADLLAAGRLGRWSPQANELHHRGFCTLDIGDEDTHQDCHELVDVFEKQLAQELEDWEAGRMGSTRIQDAWRQHPAARRLALHPSVLDLLRQVYGRDPFAFQTLNFAVGSEQPYHSDAVHFPVVIVSPTSAPPASASPLIRSPPNAIPNPFSSQGGRMPSSNSNWNLSSTCRDAARL